MIDEPFILRIGLMQLAPDRIIHVGDPCYYSSARYAVKDIDTGWSEENHPVFLISGNAAGTYRSHPQGLMVVKNSFNFNWPIDKKSLKYIGPLGVDSGQIGMISSQSYNDWEDSDDYDFKDPKDDYSSMCQSSLTGPLFGGASRLHSIEDEHETISTAFCSSTYYGDGEYPVYLLVDFGCSDLNMEELKNSDLIKGILVDFDGLYEDEYQNDYYSDSENDVS